MTDMIIADWTATGGHDGLTIHGTDASGEFVRVSNVVSIESAGTIRLSMNKGAGAGLYQSVSVKGVVLSLPESAQ